MSPFPDGVRISQVVRRIARSSLVPLALAAVALPVAAAAQAPAAPASVTVSGQVTDQKTGQPLSGVLVEIGNLKRRSVTDEQGRYSFRKVKTGDHVVMVTHLGYAAWMNAVEVSGDGELDIALEPDPVVLEGITVRLNVLERRRRAVAASSRLFDRRWIASSASPNMQDFIRTYTGIYPVPCVGGADAGGSALGMSSFGMPSECVYSRGSATPLTLVIDEMPAFGLDQLAMYRPSEVHRVEVYQGGRHIRVYTSHFVEQVARGQRRVQPVFW